MLSLESFPHVLPSPPPTHVGKATHGLWGGTEAPKVGSLGRQWGAGPGGSRWGWGAGPNTAQGLQEEEATSH